MEADEIPRQKLDYAPSAGSEDDPDWSMDDVKESDDDERHAPWSVSEDIQEVSLADRSAKTTTEKVVSDSKELQESPNPVAKRSSHADENRCDGIKALGSGRKESSGTGVFPSQTVGIKKPVSVRCSPRLTRLSACTMAAKRSTWVNESAKMPGKKRLPGTSVTRAERSQNPLVNGGKEAEDGKLESDAGFVRTGDTGNPNNIAEDATERESTPAKPPLKPTDTPACKTVEAAIVQDSAEYAIQKYKPIPQCVQCQEVGTFAKNGTTRFNGRILKCGSCNKQVTGKAVITLLESQVGSDWKKRGDQYCAPMVLDTSSQSACPISRTGAGKTENGDFTKVPTKVWKSMVESLNTLTAQQQSLLHEQLKLTSALAKAQERMIRLENEVACNAKVGNTLIASSSHTAPNQNAATHAKITNLGPAAHNTTGTNGLLSIENEAGKNMEVMRKTVNWADIAKRNITSAKCLPPDLAVRVQKAIYKLDTNKIRVLKEPETTAVYFKNIRQGPLGVLRAALRECLPSWAVLGLGFIGSSVLEIITDARLKSRLIATLNAMGVQEIPNFDMFYAGLKRASTGEPGGSAQASNLMAAIRRLTVCTSQFRSQYAKLWYNDKLKEAQVRLKQERERHNKPKTQQANNDERSESVDGEGVVGTEQAGNKTKTAEEGWKLVKKSRGRTVGSIDTAGVVSGGDQMEICNETHEHSSDRTQQQQSLQSVEEGHAKESTQQ